MKTETTKCRNNGPTKFGVLRAVCPWAFAIILTLSIWHHHIESEKRLLTQCQSMWIPLCDKYFHNDQRGKK